MTFAGLLVATALAGCVGAIALLFSHAVLTEVRWQQARRESASAAQAGLETFLKEIRMGGFSGRGGTLAAVTVAGPDAIEVLADLNGDGDLDDANERIAYRTDPIKKTLMRASGGGSGQPFLRNLSSGGFRLRFADAAGIPLGGSDSSLGPEARARIKLVEVEIQVEPVTEMGAASGNPVRLTGRIVMRNR